MERPDLERTMEQVLPYGKSITWKQRQTIQVGSGKLNQMPQEKNISKWLLLEIHSVSKLVKRLTIQLEKRGLWFILQILNNYFGVGEEKNNILFHALYDKFRRKKNCCKASIIFNSRVNCLKPYMYMYISWMLQTWSLSLVCEIQVDIIIVQQ